MTIQISIPIDESTKQQFEKVCENIGISPSNAFSMFIKDVINSNSIPYNSIASQKNSKMSREAMFGCMRGQFKMADDFDAPLEDFKEYME